MYEFIKVSEHDYYIDCPAKIGIVKISPTECIAIDSGNNKDAGKKVLKILDEANLKLVAIYNTHSHADHIGGNRLLQSRTGCKIYATGIESAFTNNPILEPALLYGSYPPSALKSRFLYAEESVCEPLTDTNLLGGITPIELPGHCFGMVGFKTSDETVFLADCISSKETLQKYAIGYLIDVEKYLETLKFIESIDAKCFVPSHAEATTDIKELAEFNAKTVLDTASEILNMLETPISFEALAAKVFGRYNVAQNEVQYALVGNTVKAYLRYLAEQGTAKYEFKDGLILWEKI